MHDSGIEVTLAQLQSPNFIKTKKHDKKDSDEEPTQVWQVHDALANYMTVMHNLWPTNYAPIVIQRILVDNRWAWYKNFNQGIRNIRSNTKAKTIFLDGFIVYFCGVSPFDKVHRC